ncbi:MAG: hypothetical protein ABSB42_10765 [Tepidisphaeraceae bacterium]
MLDQFDLRLKDLWFAWEIWKGAQVHQPDQADECWEDVRDHGRGLIAWLKNPTGITSKAAAAPATVTPPDPAAAALIGGGKESQGKTDDATTADKRLENMEQLLVQLATKTAAKKWYTVEEFAVVVGRALYVQGVAPPRQNSRRKIHDTGRLGNDLGD